MKFIHTALAAATLAVAAPAFAGLVPASSGDSELFLVMYDDNKQVSYTFDLGVTSKAFRLDADITRPTGTISPTTGVSSGTDGYSRSWAFDGSSGSEFDKFMGALGGDTSAVRWFVTGADGSGSAGLNQRSIVTTVTNGASTSGMSNQAITNAAGTFDAYAIVVNFSGDAAMMGDTSLHGAAFGSVALGNYALTPNDSANFLGNDGAGQYNFTTDNGLGETSQFAYFGRSSTAAAATPVKDLFNNDQNIGLFSIAQPVQGQYALQYNLAAVPEPGTYALLIAGLALVGAAARRRKA